MANTFNNTFPFNAGKIPGIFISKLVSAERYRKGRPIVGRVITFT